MFLHLLWLLLLLAACGESTVLWPLSRPPLCLWSLQFCLDVLRLGVYLHLPDFILLRTQCSNLRMYVFHHFWEILLIVDSNIVFSSFFVSFLPKTPTWIILYLLILPSKSLKYKGEVISVVPSGKMPQNCFPVQFPLQLCLVCFFPTVQWVNFSDYILITRIFFSNILFFLVSYF